jgi:hypothetical protein
MVTTTEITMKHVVRLLVVMVVAVPLWASTYVVKSVKGTVEVRRGVAEEWKALKAGDQLKPEDTMRTGERSSAIIQFDGKQLLIPAQTMVDLADFRQMSQEEFLLKLAMENILAVPPRENGTLATPRTTILHGSDAGKENLNAQQRIEMGLMQLQGAKLLYDNAFYATSILKTKETFRLYPTLHERVDARLRVATAFERMKLAKQAIEEYTALLAERLSVEQREAVQASLQRLRKTQSLR